MALSSTNFASLFVDRSSFVTYASLGFLGNTSAHSLGLDGHTATVLFRAKKKGGSLFISAALHELNTSQFFSLVLESFVNVNPPLLSMYATRCAFRASWFDASLRKCFQEILQN